MRTRFCGPTWGIDGEASRVRMTPIPGWRGHHWRTHDRAGGRRRHRRRGGRSRGGAALARDVVVSGMVDRLVERVGGKVLSADGNGDGPEHALRRNIVAAFAEYERALIRARTRAALAVKRARSERVGQDAVRERRGRGCQAGARREGAGTGRAHQGASRPPAHHQEHRSDAEPGWRSGAGRTLARDDRRPPAASRCLECTHPEARDGRPDRPRRPAEQPHQPPGPPVAHDEVLRFGVDPAFPAERRSPTR